MAVMAPLFTLQCNAPRIPQGPPTAQNLLRRFKLLSESQGYPAPMLEVDNEKCLENGAWNRLVLTDTYSPSGSPVCSAQRRLLALVETVASLQRRNGETAHPKTIPTPVMLAQTHGPPCN
jgi:hypothetical protein